MSIGTLEKEYKAYKHTHRMNVYHGIRVGAIAERLKVKLEGVYTKRVKEILGKDYRHINPLRKLYRAAKDNLEDLERFVQDIPVTDPVELTPFLWSIDDWAQGRAITKLMSDLKILPSGRDYTNVNKNRLANLNTLYTVVGAHIERCPEEVQKVYEEIKS